jgi:hypothetical protein
MEIRQTKLKFLAKMLFFFFSVTGGFLKLFYVLQKYCGHVNMRILHWALLSRVCSIIHHLLQQRYFCAGGTTTSRRSQGPLHAYSGTKKPS